MNNFENAKKELKRTDEIKNLAKELMTKEGLNYSDAYNKALHQLGVEDMENITENEYGKQSFITSEAFAAFGEKINGRSIDTISPKKVEILLTAYYMGVDVNTLDIDLKADKLQREVTKEYENMQKTKKKDKVLEFTKNDYRKDANAA